MTTLEEALVAVRDRLDEVAPSNPSITSAWTDPQLRQWIIEGCNDIARVTESLQDRDTITTVATVQEYDVAANALRIHRVELTADGSTYPLEIIELRNGDSLWYGSRTQTSGRPQYVSFWGFPPNLKLLLYPTPTRTGDTITVFHYRLPTALVTDGTDDTETLEIPTGWEDLVYEYATALALQRDANESWQQHRSIYEARLADMVTRTTRWHDQADQIVPDPMLYGGGFGFFDDY